MLIGLYWAAFSTVNFSPNEQSTTIVLTKYLITQGFQSQNVNFFFSTGKGKKKKTKPNQIKKIHNKIRVKMIIFKLRHILLQTNTRQSLCKWLLLFLS